METIVQVLALLASSLSATAAGGAGDGGAPRSTAVREAGGASAMVTVSARIISAPARVGAGFGPPQPQMVARRTMVSAADGGLVPALVYDFE